MIEFVEGTIVEKSPRGVVLQVGGVGIRLLCPLSVLESLPGVGGKGRLSTRLEIRGERPVLYGFLRPEEAETFDLLLSVPGVGPRLALSVLSFLSPEALRKAVEEEDLALLVSVPGVGKKTARRLLTELKERLGTARPLPPGWSEARAALLELGYTAEEVGAALLRLEGLPDGAGPEEVLRAALRVLASREGG